MSEPRVACIVCGHTGRPQEFGMIASGLKAPHRWMCRDREACKSRAPQEQMGGFGNGTYELTTTDGPNIDAHYSGDGTPL